MDYSTTEQDTGKKWIDGKSIYQKTFIFNNLSGSVNNLSLDINNMDNLISSEGVAYLSGYTNVYSLNFATPATNNDARGYWINIDNPATISFRFGNATMNKVFITIQYTKNNS